VVDKSNKRSDSSLTQNRIGARVFVRKISQRKHRMLQCRRRTAKQQTNQSSRKSMLHNELAINWLSRKCCKQLNSSFRTIATIEFSCSNKKQDDKNNKPFHQLCHCRNVPCIHSRVLLNTQGQRIRSKSSRLQTSKEN
jgi:hypothetical protein